jgi:hypothetical protein
MRSWSRSVTWTRTCRCRASRSETSETSSGAHSGREPLRPTKAASGPTSTHAHAPLRSFNGVDNGFLRFDHVRVPHDALLSRYARVDAVDGAYRPPPPSNAKASYATMVYVRATIVRDAGEFLGRAATIATRRAGRHWLPLAGVGVGWIRLGAGRQVLAAPEWCGGGGGQACCGWVRCSRRECSLGEAAGCVCGVGGWKWIRQAQPGAGWCVPRHARTPHPHSTHNNNTLHTGIRTSSPTPASLPHAGTRPCAGSRPPARAPRSCRSWTMTMCSRRCCRSSRRATRSFSW